MVGSCGTQLPSQRVSADSWLAFASGLLAAQGGEDLFSHEVPVPVSWLSCFMPTLASH